jgi:hypothetical protein
MIFGDEPRFHKDLKPLFDGGEIFAIGGSLKHYHIRVYITVDV